MPGTGGFLEMKVFYGGGSANRWPKARVSAARRNLKEARLANGGGLPASSRISTMLEES